MLQFVKSSLQLLHVIDISSILKWQMNSDSLHNREYEKKQKTWKVDSEKSTVADR